MLKKFLPAVMIAALFVGCQTPKPGNITITEEDSEATKISYMFGYRNGESIKGLDSLDWDLNAITQGFYDALEDNDQQLTDQQMQQMMSALQLIAQQQQMADQQKRQSSAGDNLQKGKDFLAENLTKEGVQETETGLQYKVLEDGSGNSPSADDKVKVHYEGKLLNGEIFDSSYKRGEPITFSLGQVIPGWTEGVQLMKEGATYEFYIPSELAYGAQGSRNIGPNETLIFKVELLEINPQ
jgi:FKBP-type peptidyl-prolyl cis-trans isomerase FklB